MKDYSYHDFIAHLGVSGAHPGGMLLTEKILTKVHVTPDSKVLDVGCGTGQTSAFIAKKFTCSITALDIHPLMIAKAKQRFKQEKLNIHLIQEDICKLHFEDHTFDLLISESVTTFTSIADALQQYARVLKPSGILLLLEMTAERPVPETEMQEFRRFYGIQSILTEQEWIDQLKQAGFSNTQVISGETVASALAMQNVSNSGGSDFILSEPIDPQLYLIWNQHIEYTEKYARRLGYRVYRASKKTITSSE